MSGINGVRNQTFNVASYLVPSLKPLAERQVALPGFLRPVLGGASGTASMGTLVLAGMTPMYYVAKTGVTTCQRYLQSRAQNHRVDHALNGAHRDSVAALDHAELALQADRRRYKTLAQRSVLPTWTQLLMAAVPGILLAPELGAAALVVGAVAGASQVASNLWERSANKGMVQETQKNINHVTTKRDLLNARRDLYLMGKRMDRLEALHPELRGQ
ncbi:hypothetical protein GZ77_25455 [Endozoicomonas montiporae]|uniref:Uncharacterized protein n=2 Tax=Endozoicomonas montiporae TaxID=1027273 RepID=A0A081MZ26_9GAMM|nr:hypothetical protein GZ77_25455 [Endozoicomonas montiporae]